MTLIIKEDSYELIKINYSTFILFQETPYINFKSDILSGRVRDLSPNIAYRYQAILINEEYYSYRLIEKLKTLPNKLKVYPLDSEEMF